MIIVSMLGHSHGPHNPSLKILYSLQDQIDHKIQCVDKLRSQFTSQGDGKQPKFIICGHSIGSYIGSEVFTFPIMEYIRFLKDEDF